MRVNGGRNYEYPGQRWVLKLVVKYYGFRFVGSAEDMENEKLVFQPEMVHQIYGDNENIFGYKDLKVEYSFIYSSNNEIERIYLDIRISR